MWYLMQKYLLSKFMTKISIQINRQRQCLKNNQSAGIILTFRGHSYDIKLHRMLVLLSSCVYTYDSFQ